MCMVSNFKEDGSFVQICNWLRMEVVIVKIISRDSWGAKPNKTKFSKLGEVKGLVIHWSAYPSSCR